MEGNQTKIVVHGALLLTLAGLISKILSATYRVPLQNLTGDFGFYIYQQIYPLIGIVMIFSLYGFPVAISKLTAEMNNKKQIIGYQNFYIPLLLILLTINSFFFILTFMMAPFISSWIGDENLQGAFRLGAILFLFIPFLALFRGVFQGHGEMRQTAYSQIIEQVIRVSIIISTAYFIYRGKLDIYSIGHAGIAATLIGMVVTISIFVLFFIPKSTIGPKVKIPWRYYLYTCLSFGMIASLNQLILILIQIVDVFTLVPSLIQNGLPPLEAMEMKGVFDRGQPLIQFGVVFGSSFALALIPTVIRENLQSQGDHQAYVRESILFGFYLAVGATIGLILILPETNILLFTNTDGTGSIRILVISILLSSVTITGCAVLQSLGHIKQTVFWIVIACVTKWILNVQFVPLWGIYGSALATVASLLLLCTAILVVLHKKMPMLNLVKTVQWKGLIIASVGMCLYIVGMKYISNYSGTFSRIGLLFYLLFIIISGAFLYVSLLLRYSVLTENQLRALPFSRIVLELQKIMVKKM